MEEKKNFDASSSWFATNVRAAEKDAPAAEKFAKRVQLVEDATALREPERIPMCPMLGALPYNLEGSSYRAAMYNYSEASDALVKFYQEFQPDATTHTGFTSGKANELAQSTMIDWPGRPGTSVPDFSTHQV